MQCVANYEIRSEVSVARDDTWLPFEHPKGAYKARIRNIARRDFSSPFLLSLHLFFDAPSLQEAKDLADERLADCLNMLALLTGSTFRLHRIRQIVDVTSSEGDQRTLLYWGDSIEYEDPQPVLDPRIMASVQRLLAHEAPPPMRRALRWYRLGVQANSPDDQFAYFWFALEILAVSREGQGEVADKCPHCKSDLFCIMCQKHPLHMPYPRQKIRTLIKAVDKDMTDEVVERLDKTRNALMHGRTLKEIKPVLLDPYEGIVDVLGEIVFRAIISQFPPQILEGGLSIAKPSTYIHRALTGVATVTTVVPQDADGGFDLSFPDMTFNLVSDDPPQSAKRSFAILTPEQYARLREIASEEGDQQAMLQRLCERRAPDHEGHIVCVLLASEDKLIEEAVKRGDKGSWQDFFRALRRRPVVRN